jgi:HEAT repeat protein
MNMQQLLGDLDSDDPARRYLAAETLGDMGKAARYALPYLIKTLRDPDPLVVEAATEALGKMPIAAVGAVSSLAKILNGDNSVLRRPAARTLSKIGEPAVSSLIICLQDHRPDVRRASVEALGLMGAEAERAIDALANRLEYDADIGVRKAVLAALERIGTQDAFTVIEQFKSSDTGSAFDNLR